MNTIAVIPVNAVISQMLLASTYYSAGYYIYWNPSKYSCFNSAKADITVTIQKYHADLKQANADRKQKIKDDQAAADAEQRDKLQKIKDDGKAECKNHVSGSKEVVTNEEVPCYVHHVSQRI